MNEIEKNRTMKMEQVQWTDTEHEIIDWFRATILGERTIEGENVLFTDEEQDKIDAFNTEHENGVKTVDEEYDTSLHSAVELGKIEVVKSLIEAGKNVNMRNRYTATPLFIAVACEHLEIAKLLIEAGAKVNMEVGIFNVKTEVERKIENWITPLDWVIEQLEVKAIDKQVVNLKMVEYLLSVGARLKNGINNKCTQQKYESDLLDELRDEYSDCLK